ncbi:MAG: SMR family transporter [Chitinophagales bacterium]
MGYLLLYASIFFNIITNVCFNLAAIHSEEKWKSKAFFIGGLACGLMNSFQFMQALKTIPLGVASPIYFSLTIVGLFLTSYFLFHETITMMQVGGVLVICVGVVMVNLK